MPGDDLASEAERLLSDFRRYDACVDIVSAAEVWFTKAEGIRETVAHFERYPTIRHRDGEQATPDFTVLFHDATAYVGELSNLALEPASLDSLCHQIGRYDSLDRVPGPGGALAEVSAIDILLFVPQGEANAAVARMSEAMEDSEHPYAPSRFPTVFGWSFERERNRYIFSLARGEKNQRPRGNGREHSLENWMDSTLSPDTLTGKPEYFSPIKVEKRFMNDPTPSLYMATLLWSAVFPTMSGGQGDISTTTTELANRLREDYGRGRANEVERALNLLKVGGLAQREGPDGWVVPHQPINRHEEDLAATLIDRFKSRPSGPVTFAARERARATRREREANRAKQTDLDD
ncbi:MAG: hypothetical protein QOE75_812 [Solirubrobacterales bacterium]|jgi:hypothetical protein|nr:hypothetical protein [Solirubrobacterales bacterium]